MCHLQISLKLRLMFLSKFGFSQSIMNQTVHNKKYIQYKSITHFVKEENVNLRHIVYDYIEMKLSHKTNSLLTN